MTDWPVQLADGPLAPYWDEADSPQADGYTWALNEACNAPGCKGYWLIYQGCIARQPVYRCATCLHYFLFSRRDIMANEKLINPGLEAPYTRREANEVIVAQGWEPWYDHRVRRPEFKAEVPDVGEGRVHSGGAAQKWFTLYDLHDAGIWQRINAVPGQWYLIRAWIYMWSSQEDDPNTSIDPGKLHAMVGMNPWGHWPQHTATVWGKELGQDQYNRYIQVECLAQAWGSEVSIVVRSWNEWKAKHNDIYVDDITVEQVTLYIDEEPPDMPPPEPPEPGEPVDVDYARFRGIVQEVNDRQTSELMLFLETGTTIGKLSFTGDE